MNDNDIVIVSVGMCTSVGLNAKQTAANVRAGTSHFGETPFCGWYGRPFTAAVIPRDALPPLPLEMTERAYFTRREGLLLRLGALGIKDCLDSFGVNQAEPIPVYLSLPEHETKKAINADAWLDDFVALNPSINRSSSRADWRGRAGGLLALGNAMGALAEGNVPLVIVGGVDTFYDPYILAILQSPGGNRVKVEGATDCFVPGEGAAFLLLTTRHYAMQNGLPLHGVVSKPSDGFEKGFRGSEEPYLGEGLADTVTRLFETAASEEPIREVYSTMNGESYWTKEWGVAQSRNNAKIAPEASMHHPADCFGDLGAAFGPALIGLAAIGLKSGYLKSPILIYASSDFGQRSALIMGQ